MIGSSQPSLSAGPVPRACPEWNALDPLELASRLREKDRVLAVLHTASGRGWSHVAVLDREPLTSLTALKDRVGSPRMTGGARCGERGRGARRTDGRTEPPWRNGWFLVLPYELGSCFERVPVPERLVVPFPELLAFRTRGIWSRYRGESAGYERPWWYMGDEECARAPGLSAGLEAKTSSGEAWRIEGDWSETPDRFGYRERVQIAKEYIAAGDIFQANIARWFSASFRGDPFGYFCALTRRNPSPFAAYVEWPALECGVASTAIVSSSPELLARVRGARIETRPIAGTYPKTRARDELPRDPKEKAEHVMLVDLERNDLGRIAVPGSVRVEELMAIEEYSHLYHIVSHIAAELVPGVGIREILRAVFPGGTITGAPKVRAMEIIAELEGVQRGIYTGSLGWLDDGGDLELNIAIRTAVVWAGGIHIAAGAGIVADSDPDREAAETSLKAEVLLTTR